MSIPEIPADDPRWTKPGAIYVPAGGGETIWVTGDVYTKKVTSADTNGAFALIEASVPAGAGPVAHSHNNNDEAFYLLSGELEFLDGDNTFVARPGDFIYVPRNTRHRFKNIAAHTARMLFMFTPAGPERAFDIVGEPARPGIQAPPPGALTAEQAAEMARYDHEIDSVLLAES